MIVLRKNFEDKTLVCVDCSDTFTFSAGEQQFFYSKNLALPKRCPPCRHHRKITLPRWWEVSADEHQ